MLSLSSVWMNVIATITGILGLLIALKTHFQVSKMKSLDLRLELRKALNRAEADCKGSPEILDYAKSSRKSIASAAGRLHSNRMQLFNKEMDSDRRKQEEINEKLNLISQKLADSNYSELECLISKTHKIQCELDDISSKYERYLREDDDARRHIRETRGSVAK